MCFCSRLTIPSWRCGGGGLGSQAAVAPAAAPGQVAGQGDVIGIFLFTFCALCTVGSTPGAAFLRPILSVVAGLVDRVQLGAARPAGLAGAGVRPLALMPVAV